MMQIRSYLSRAGLLLAWVLFLVMFWADASEQSRADIDPKYYAVQASAVVQANPPQIQLVWAPDANATGYSVYRKGVQAGSWGSGASLPGSATSYVDSGVSAGAAYEYQIRKSTSPGYVGYGFVCAGINAPLIEYRGKLLLLVDSLYAADLANELTRLQWDLAGDGWTVLRHDVSRTDSPDNIKRIIQAEYANDPTQVRTVFLFGHIPVPYSGNINPDGHPDHQGAWPADVYYGDMDGSWTDNSVSNTSAQHQANWNVPGDGKFDQSELPSDVELEVGRVDLANMTCYSNKNPARYEKDLLRQYLDKDHNFRHGLMAIQRRGLVCDNFGEKDGEAFAASGWRNFSAFFGADNVTAVPGWNYFSTLASDSYLCSYGCGGGSFYTCDGIGSSDDFAQTDIKTVFTLFIGSYFGDWDNESNFLRAPLGTTSCTLAVAWAGRPHWFLHHMGLGETIGYGTRLTQNNADNGLYPALNFGRGVHVALMGDPTLRLHPVLPPSDLKGTIGTGVTLNWTGSADSDLLGYHVYRGPGPNGPYVRLTGSDPIAQSSFTDTSSGGASATYMVRAIKLEHSASGTYLNPSEGVFFGPDSNTSWGSGAPAPTVPSAPTGLAATVNSASQVSLNWTDTANNETGFSIERQDSNTAPFVAVGAVGPNVTSFRDANLAAGTGFVYRVAAYNTVGKSDYSNVVTANTPDVPQVPASAEFVSNDTVTQGNWGSLYGTEGYSLMGTPPSYPGYAGVSASGNTDWTWAWSTADVRGLEQPDGSDRLALAWYTDTSMNVELDLRDGQPHLVSLYCVDWDSAARRETVDILDANSGAILNSQALVNFHDGVYLSWNLAGHVLIRLTHNGGYNGVVSGIFFDPAVPQVQAADAPTISPPGGQFTDPTSVTLATTTSGVDIRYTLDGTEPTASSTLYEGPFTLTASALVKAKAFKPGLAESPVSSAAFRLNAISEAVAEALFVRADNVTQGSWKGVYGSDGCQIVGDPAGTTRLPPYVDLLNNPGASYVWSDSTSDPRALQQAQNSDRVAGCWYDTQSFNLDLSFNDNKTHRLALYCLDWDNIGRSQTVDVLDSASGILLTSQSISSFASGRYLVWDIKGHVVLRLTRVAGNNAVAMGLFFSQAAAELSNPGAGSLSVAGPSAVAAASNFQFRISGQAGQRFAIQSSNDLVLWNTVQEVTLDGPTLDLTDPRSPSETRKFYRALPTSGPTTP